MANQSLFMAEIAEDMINGLYCSQCREIIDGNEPGYPRTCSSCNRQAILSGTKQTRKVLRFVPVKLDQFHSLLKQKKGWYLCEDNAHEYIFGWRSRTCPQIEIKVATTINKDNNKYRGKGKDAIRVWAIWNPKNGKTQGLVKSTSVKRTDGWQVRLENRIKDVYLQAWKQRKRK